MTDPALPCCTPGRPAGHDPSRPAPAAGGAGSSSGSRPDLVDLPGGTFRMGSDSTEVFLADGEGPVREVTLSRFRIAPCAVSNREWAEYADATGYATEAESFGWSFVFAGLLPESAAAAVIDGSVPGAPWWRGVRGAVWRHPFGPGSDVHGKDDHPVVHISYHDALLYAQWRGVRLPTEAEWEYAARGGLDQAAYPWGDELTPNGEHRTNIWQGRFPSVNTGEDGYVGTAPVATYEPNGFGLYNMAGNVWEWTTDWFSPTWHRTESHATRVDPTGPATGQGKVVKGGSHLCHLSYCNRYRCSARTQVTPDSSLSHTGFRVAADSP